jgi:hypothetical protein
MRPPCHLRLCISPYQRLNAWTNIYETWYVQHGTWAHLDAYFINPAHQSTCVYVNAPIDAKQMIDKNVTAATNTHATIEELLDVSFSTQSVSYQRKVGDYFRQKSSWLPSIPQENDAIVPRLHNEHFLPDPF